MALARIFIYMKIMQRAPTFVTQPADHSVGARIREQRKSASVSLQQLADRTGLSIGYLSQVERGVSSASIKAIALIADGLSVDIAALFPNSTEGSANGRLVFRQSERSAFGPNMEGVRKELLTPGEGGGLRLFLMEIEPGGHSGDTLYAHAGEEAGTVLSGELHLTVETESWLLAEGDSFRFASGRPHRWHNASAMPCRVLWINAN